MPIVRKGALRWIRKLDLPTSSTETYALTVHESELYLCDHARGVVDNGLVATHVVVARFSKIDFERSLDTARLFFNPNRFRTPVQ